MSRFIKIGAVIVNIDLICAVTERYVSETIPSSDDLPFGETRRVRKGVNVFFGVTTEESFIPFESETIDSFLKKISEVV
ncbi:hypothetical protein [Acinetobacter gerneri]|uniref:hypothetical protein n=1 Tax=Acinetobacter gerneri TaxID=202952 RepID=UPI0028AC5C08|nr:hypothetical protein [Acinetobacter gerneri]